VRAVKVALLGALAVGALAVGGCVRVHPHARELLADPAMQAPVWPALDRIDEHTRAVSEGTEGATASGGGGCGCN
jgi:hypothetical protein